MSWLRLDDTCDSDPLLIGIARSRAEADRFLGILTALKLYCARHHSDGFLPELVVAERLRGRRVRELFTDPPHGGTALLHQRGSVCDCLKDRPWPPGATYAVHDYLQTNPTREEYDLARAKSAELRDRELTAAVRRRDRDRCRYCATECTYADRRSARGLVIDHVDPSRAEGAANLVVACRGCNSRKGQRTPAAAGMSLLPLPEERLRLVDALDLDVDTDPSWPASGDDGDVDGPPGSTAPPAPASWPTTDQTSEATNQVTSRSATGPTTHVPGRDGTGRVNDPDPVPQQRDCPEPGDAGPAGHRDRTGPPRPRRRSVHPDPYRRGAVTGPDPADHAGLPPPDDEPGPPHQRSAP